MSIKDKKWNIIFWKDEIILLLLLGTKIKIHYSYRNEKLI